MRAINQPTRLPDTFLTQQTVQTFVLWHYKQLILIRFIIGLDLNGNFTSIRYSALSSRWKLSASTSTSSSSLCQWRRHTTAYVWSDAVLNLVWLIKYVPSTIVRWYALFTWTVQARIAHGTTERCWFFLNLKWRNNNYRVWVGEKWRLHVILNANGDYVTSIHSSTSYYPYRPRLRCCAAAVWSSSLAENSFM